MTLPYSELLSLTPSAKIYLYVLDATGIGGAVSYFCASSTAAGANIVWQGVTYTAIPIEAEGFATNAKGTLPRPKITVSNIGGVVGAMVRDFKDLVGAKLIRKVTYAKHLDGMPGADPNRCMPDEIWIINQKTSEVPESITFELMAPIDAQGMKLPRGIIQATTCRWSSENTDVCPYVMTCDKGLATANGCKVHYPTGNLPFGAFPGTQSIGS
ncbi:phage minor tail protein L [Mesoterricola silvestris]|uniref:Phage tail protein n=1 Tax=Mesoterricola silvestris TaxID=2927979 RepID=A0AA48GJE5_9BACT|nr:phage minor tail protein L [Mesoterricola silvestris]BDU72402.1 putative phage tail protein [Mesoterricola silvestris]